MGLIEAGKLTPIIYKTYPLEEATDAMRYLETGHVPSMIVIRVAG